MSKSLRTSWTTGSSSSKAEFAIIYVTFFFSRSSPRVDFCDLEKRAPLSISFLSCGILHKIAGNQEKVFEINNFWRVKKTWQ